MPARRDFNRKRYIAFEIVSGEAGLTRKLLSREIVKRKEMLGPDPKFEVIMITRGRGIVLTTHLQAKRMTDLLNSFSLEDNEFQLRTLKISGTILTLKRKYFPNKDTSGNGK